MLSELDKPKKDRQTDRLYVCWGQYERKRKPNEIDPTITIEEREILLSRSRLEEEENRLTQMIEEKLLLLLLMMMMLLKIVIHRWYAAADR